jgi:hypothetical protein
LPAEIFFKSVKSRKTGGAKNGKMLSAHVRGYCKKISAPKWTLWQRPKRAKYFPLARTRAASRTRGALALATARAENGRNWPKSAEIGRNRADRQPAEKHERSLRLFAALRVLAARLSDVARSVIDSPRGPTRAGK